MKRTLLFAALLALLVSAFAAPTLATPVEELGDLARYFPAESPVFFSIRTDPSFLEELDAVLGTIVDGLPSGSVPPITLQAALDMSIQQEYGDEATFENTVGAWLGDTAAMGATSLDNLTDDDFMNNAATPFLVAVSISDRDAAQDFFEQLIEDGGTEFTQETQGAFTVYLQDDGESALAIGDDVLLIAASVDDLNLDGDFQSLASAETFTTTTGLLPESSYNALVYLNLGDLLLQSVEMMIEESKTSGMSTTVFEDLMPIYENYPTQAVGFTVLEGRSLTIDFASTGVDFASFEGTAFEGLNYVTGAAPVDLAFAEYIPADAPFFIQGTNLGATIDYGLQALAATIELGIDSAAEFSTDEEVPPFVRNLNANSIRAFVDLGVAGLTGLNLQDDVLPTLNGNAALFGRILPSEATTLTYDTAVVVEVTDSAGIQTVYDSIVSSLELYEVEFTQTDNAVILPGVIRALLADAMPVRMLRGEEFDFVIGLSDAVFTVGTRPGAEFALEAGGESLADDAAFVDAQQFFLPDAQFIGYVGMAQIQGVLDLFVREMPNMSSDSQDMRDATAILSLFDSATISTVIHEDASVVQRLSLTLAE